MIYRARFAELHAEPIVVNGVSGFVAECGGVLQPITKEVFEFFFDIEPQTREPAPAASVSRKKAEKKQATALNGKAAESKTATGGRPSPTRDAILAALKKRGPLTTDELVGIVKPDAKSGSARRLAAATVSQTAHAAKGLGLVTRVQDTDGVYRWAAADE